MSVQSFIKIIFLFLFFTCWPPIQPAHASVKSSIDLASLQADRNGVWFSQILSSLPQKVLQPRENFQVMTTPIDNRKNGQISSQLLAGYFFLQWDISRSFFEQYAHTIQAVFIKSALLSFVDYPNNKVLDWWRHSSYISTDVMEVIRSCKERLIPVYLFLNY